MARKRLGLVTTGTSLYSFISAFKAAQRGDSDDTKDIVNQPYQRGNVWGKERKRNLIYSLLIGVPVGAIVANDRVANYQAFEDAGEEANARAIIDGKQRLSAIIGFHENEFSVPADWFDSADIAPEHQGNDEVFYSELTRGAQRDFEMIGIPMSLASVPSVEAEEEIFNLINFGGVAQGDSDF